MISVETIIMYLLYLESVMDKNPTQSLDQDLPSTPTSSIASPISLDDFKKENQQKHTGRKAKPSKSKEADEELVHYYYIIVKLFYCRVFILQIYKNIFKKTV
jgi:hypothetical protein